MRAKFFSKFKDKVIKNTNMNNKYSCDKCDLVYQTQCGLKKHIKLKHQTVETKQYKCKYCDAPFGYRQSKWLHEQKCKTINEIPLAEEVKNLKAELKELKAKPSSIINNTTNNIQYVLKSPGSESIDHLTTEKQREIMQKGLNSLTYLIEVNNFNKDIPENHTYCVTALNDKHASVINPETNTITKADKNTLFDKVLVSNLSNLEKIAKNPDFKITEKKEYEEKIKNLKDVLFRNRKSMKRYYTEINLLSYNNKDMIQETWASLNSLEKIIEPENIQSKILVKNNDLLEYEEEPNKKIQIVPDIYADDSGSELSTDSDDSDTEEVEFADIIIKNITYILEGNKLYQKKGSDKGDFYGTYFNGKVKKATKHINL